MLRFSRAFLFVGVLLMTACATTQTTPARSLGGPLNLADEGMFFVNGRVSSPIFQAPLRPALQGLAR